jgi:hypothetical protein
MQTRNLWDYMRESMDQTKAAPLADSRVQPLQVMDISDYEKLLGFVENGESLAGMLAHKVRGPYRERDLAAWLHSRGAPSDEPRLSVLERRWEEMTERLVHGSPGAAGAAIADVEKRQEPANGTDG